MYISYKPLWHTLIDKGMSKEQLRQKAGLTTNMIANMGKEQNISMSTLARICEALDCQITDVIALAPGDPPTIGGKHDKESNKTDS
jgi:DNA-binding Xre family transcriptional regulator